MLVTAVSNPSSSVGQPVLERFKAHTGYRKLCCCFSGKVEQVYAFGYCSPSLSWGTRAVQREV